MTERVIIHGYQFNDMVGDNVFITLLDDDTDKGNHVDREFVHVDNIGHIYNESNRYCRMITVPDDARVTIREYTYVSNDIHLWDIIAIDDLIIWDNDEISKLNIKRNGLLLRFAKNKSFERCFDAVNNDPRAYVYVPVEHRKDIINMLAVKGLGKNIELVPEQTSELQMEAVINDINTLMMIKKPTLEVKNYVIDRDPMMLMYLEQDEDLCIRALEKTLDAFHHVKDKTYRICKYVLDRDMSMLNLVPDDIATEILRDINDINDSNEYDKFMSEEDFAYNKFIAPSCTYEMLSLPGTSNDKEEDLLL